MKLVGALRAELAGAAGETGLVLRRTDGQVVMRYGEVYAYDAAGKELPVAVALSGQELRLQVDDARARYPLTVDPLVFSEQARFTDTVLRVVASESYGGAVAIYQDTALVSAVSSHGPPFASPAPRQALEAGREGVARHAALIGGVRKSDAMTTDQSHNRPSLL